MMTGEGTSDQPELLLYPAVDEYIAKINLVTAIENGKLNKSRPSTVVILDRSSSMDSSVERFVNIILPLVFHKLNYSPHDAIHLITFDTVAEKIDTTVGSMPFLRIYCQGTTFMKNAIDELRQLMQNVTSKDYQPIRLLTISDGQAYDQDETVTAAVQLCSLIGQKFKINSQAVRLFTSVFEPDTRAVSSLLQLNNVRKKVSLLDLNAQYNDEYLATSIHNLFIDDFLEYEAKFSSEEYIIKEFPWHKTCTNKIFLAPGENIFWVNSTPTKPLLLENNVVPAKVQPELSTEEYVQTLEPQIEQYMTHLKVLKVVDTVESTAAITDIVQYFQKLENNIIHKEEDMQLILNDHSLRSRLHYLKKLITERRKTFSMRMAQIANDERFARTDSAQQAEYIRTVDNTKNSRGFAYHTVAQGTGFNEIARREVRAMFEHIQELKDVDDKDHSVSFYSLETTLGGIRAVCELVQQDMLDDLDAYDILLLLNIVGVACSGPVGDFPDQLTWHVNDLYLECYASLSDVLIATVQSNGIKLKTPKFEKEITNVIPIFEDIRILSFLRNHAPSLVEYTCCIGMREVITDAPTYTYTMGAAIWRMIEDLNFERDALHLKTFELMVLNYELSAGNYFDQILPHLQNQNQGNKSFYIGNNGITNMISPLISMYRTNSDNLQYISDILRALYTYEVWQAMRRLCKDDSDTIVSEILTKLLGNEINNSKTTVKRFTVYQGYTIDEEYLSELVKEFYNLKYITQLPRYIEAVITGNTNSIVHIPPITEKTICKALNINYGLRTFHLFNIIQSLLYLTEASRIDKENKVMKIEDLNCRDAGERMMRHSTKLNSAVKFNVVPCQLHHKMNNLTNLLTMSCISWGRNIPVRANH